MPWMKDINGTLLGVVRSGVKKLPVCYPALSSLTIDTCSRNLHTVLPERPMVLLSCQRLYCMQHTVLREAAPQVQLPAFPQKAHLSRISSVEKKIQTKSLWIQPGRESCPEPALWRTVLPVFGNGRGPFLLPPPTSVLPASTFNGK
jgi:hypothetical protein